MYRVRGQFVAYDCNGKMWMEQVSRNELRRGRDTSGPYNRRIGNIFSNCTITPIVTSFDIARKAAYSIRYGYATKRSRRRCLFS